MKEHLGNEVYVEAFGDLLELSIHKNGEFTNKIILDEDTYTNLLQFVEDVMQH